MLNIIPYFLQNPGLLFSYTTALLKTHLESSVMESESSSTTQNVTLTWDLVANITMTPTPQQDGELAPSWDNLTGLGFVVCFLVLMGGNALIIFGVARFRVLQHSSNIFVAVLAAVDLTFLFTIILKFVEWASKREFNSLGICQLRCTIAVTNVLSSELALLGKLC